ncbi:hypothetical protein [Amycolatopsis kentuckyensis]|uniref:hypothetical protein n=1 Tax=Amycolatopsis kentuckyensis TaxID=218823 RepID=UPI0035630501
MLEDFGDPAFDERARRHRLQAALIIREAENHGEAVRHWTRDDDGTATLALDRFRDHLAEATGRRLLPGFTPPVRSTSHEVVLAERAQRETVRTKLDERDRRLTPAARQMCVLPAADQRFCGRGRLLNAVPAASVVWL